MNDDLTAFDLTGDEIQNIDKTVEALRVEIMEHIKNGATAPETLLHRLKKAYKVKEERDFNNQFPYENT